MQHFFRKFAKKKKIKKMAVCNLFISVSCGRIFAAVLTRITTTCTRKYAYNTSLEVFFVLNCEREKNTSTCPIQGQKIEAKNILKSLNEKKSN